MIDRFTHWIELAAMNIITAEKTVEQIIHSIVGRYGTPTTILSDNGPQFRSEITSQFCRLLKITHIYSSPYHPQTNGIVERVQQTIKLALRALVNINQTDWDDYLPHLMFTLNTTPHMDYQLSPYQLLFGVHPPMPDSTTALLLQSSEDDIAPMQISTQQYLNELSQRLYHIHHLVHQLQLLKSVIPSQPTTVKPPISVGTYVYVKEIAVANKLAPLYKGPYLVTHVSPKGWITVLREDNRTQLVSKSNIKLDIIPEPIEIPHHPPVPSNIKPKPIGRTRPYNLRRR